MNPTRHPIVTEDLDAIIGLPLPWETLRGTTVLVSGCNGFIPAYLVEILLRLNERDPDFRIDIVGLARDRQRAEARFKGYHGRADLRFIIQDVNQPLPPDASADFVIHAATQASPRYYEVDPIGVLSPNILGTHHLLTCATNSGARGFLFLSSGEVYGRVDPDRMPFHETDFGPLDPLHARSCYAESKRMGETMCRAWWKQHHLRTTIARLGHTYGPEMRLDDGRVFADFVADVLARRPIQLKSDGAVSRPFCYLADAVAGLFTVLLSGAGGEAYNVVNETCETTIRSLAHTVAGLFPELNLHVAGPDGQRWEPPLESARPPACVDTSKARALGWNPSYGVADGFRRTIESFLP